MQQYQLNTEKDGIALAASMLEEIESMGPDQLDALAIEPEFRDGKPQNNFVLEHLKAISMHGNEAALVGFASALSDFLATDGRTCASFYQEIALASA